MARPRGRRASHVAGRAPPGGVARGGSPALPACAPAHRLLGETQGDPSIGDDSTRSKAFQIAGRISESHSVLKKKKERKRESFEFKSS